MRLRLHKRAHVDCRNIWPSSACIAIVRPRAASACAGKEAKRGRKRKRSSNASASEGRGLQHAPQAFGKVVAYCTGTACRRAAVLLHFGERLPRGGCSGCDYCQDAAAVEQQVKGEKESGARYFCPRYQRAASLRVALHLMQTDFLFGQDHGRTGWSVGNQLAGIAHANIIILISDPVGCKGNIQILMKAAAEGSFSWL